MKNIFTTLSIFVLFIAGIIVSKILFDEVEDRTLKNHYQQLEIYATQASISIEDYFQHFQHSLKFLAKKEEIIQFNDDSKSLIKSYFEAHIDELSAVTRISPNGIILYTYPERKDLIGLDVSNQKHNAQIIKSHSPIISDVFTTVQGYDAIVFAYPIFDEQENYCGAISIVVPFNHITNKFLKDLKIGATGNSFLISEAGYELFCFNKDHIGKSVYDNISGFEKLKELVDNMLSKKEGSFEYSYFQVKDGDEIIDKIAYYKPIFLENTFWSLAIVTSKNEVLEANRGFLVKFLILLTLMFALIAIVLHFYFKEKRKAKDEIINKELKYKNDLEKIVKIRTDELNQLNQSLKKDITHRKKIEKELKNAVEKVEKSEKIKSEFLAQMSHEIRTPINTILSFSSLIKEELSQYANEELNYGFSGIQSAGKRLIRTIDLILNMSDIQLGTHDYYPKELDICADIIDNLVVEYRVQLHEKKLELKLDKKTTNTKIVADSYTVNQIFANLIDNAIKYTHKGKISILCERNYLDELCISVVDTGVGISTEYLPRIFDEFSQEDMGYTRKFEGNGLGLALVKKYCELNNAQILVESVKHEGSKFRVIFKNTIN